MSLLDNLPHLCNAKRRGRTPDGMMGSVDTFTTTVFTNKACWCQPASDQQVDWWHQRSANITDNLYFSEDPGVDENCVIEIGDWRFDVISKAEPDYSVGLGVLWRVVINRFERIAA